MPNLIRLIRQRLCDYRMLMTKIADGDATHKV
jgi:hypothetical protein